MHFMLNLWLYRFYSIVPTILFISPSESTIMVLVLAGATQPKPSMQVLFFFFYDFISYFCFLIREVAGVFCHNFIFWIYGFFRILFPFRIQDIRLCEFECCYLILLCSRIGKPSFECVTVFCWYITFKTDALAVSFCYWPDKATTVR